MIIKHWADKFKWFRGFNMCLYCNTKIWKPKVFCKPEHAKQFANMLK